MFVSYVPENDKAFLKTLSDASKSARSLKVPFKEIARDFYQSQKAIFKLKSKGQYPAYKGPKIKDTWKNPGRPDMRTRDGGLTAYENYKMKAIGRLYPMLVLNGDLSKSILSGNDTNSIYKVTNNSLEIGTKISYGPVHQLGSKTVPMRKFLFIGPEAPKNVPAVRGRLDRWTKIIEAYLVQKALGGKK